MKLSWLLLVRLMAGGIGFFPPLAAAILLDPGQYGLGVSAFAIGQLVVGPVAQYASQGYMRALLLSGEGRVAASHVVVVFAGLVAIGLAVAGAAGIVTAIGAAIFLFVILSVTIAKLEEVRQVSMERQLTSVILFYIVPPFVTTLSFLIAARLGIALPWPAIATIMGGGYLLPGIASIVMRGGRPFVAAAGFRPRHAGLLWRDSRTFLLSGIIGSATENMPTLALTLFGIPERVATFEVMRKLSSAISVFLHGLAIAFAPTIITAAARGDMGQVVTTIRQNAKLAMLFAAIYIPAAIVAVFLLGSLGWRTLDIPAAMAVPLLLSALVTCVAAPFGMAVSAFHLERWWVVGGIAGCAAFAIVLPFAGWFGAMEVVALAVLAQNTVLSATISMVVVRTIRSRTAEPAPGTA